MGSLRKKHRDDMIRSSVLLKNVSKHAMEEIIKVQLLGGGEPGEDQNDPKSRQIDDDPFQQMAAGEFVTPKYNPLIWASAMEQNTRLARSIRTFARNTVGLGWYLEPIHRLTKETARAEREHVEEQIAELRDLLEHPNEFMPFTQLCYLMKVDEEATGNGYIEVVRNNSGRICKLYHAPAITMRLRKIRGKTSEEATVSGFVQIRGSQKRYFKSFGDLRPMDAFSGEYYSGRTPLPVERRASEILHFKIYSPTSTYYGVPRYVSSAAAISGNRLASLRNVAFFENDAPQPVDTPVLTPDGWRQMGDLRPGNEVIGRDGGAHVVLRVVEQGIKDVYRVRFDDGGSTECTLGHLWTVSNEYDRARGVLRTMTLEQIMADGFRYNCGTTKWAVPLVEPVQYRATEPLPIDPYLMGLLLGDGALRLANGSSVILVAGREDIEELEGALVGAVPVGVEAVLRARSGGFSGSTSGHGEFRFRRAGNLRGAVPPNPINTAIRELGLCDVVAETKFIPRRYLMASVDARVALLQGLIDSDGSVWGTAIRFTTASRRLAEGVRELVFSLGGVATIRQDCGRNTSTVTIRKRFPEWIIPARLERKVAAYQIKREMPRIRGIVGAEFSRKAETRCIQLDTEDDLYVTENFIVTHNTPRLAVLVSGGRLTAESIQNIEEFFRSKVRGTTDAHRAMVIQVEPQKVGFQQESKSSIELMPLTVGVTEDASFQTFREANDNEVRESFGLAPVFFQTHDVNKASAAVAREITNEQEFEPDRLEKEFIINQTIVQDLFGKDVRVRFRFERLQLTDPLDKARIDQIYASLAAFTPNELRESMGKPKFPPEFVFADKPLSIAMAELSQGLAMAILGGIPVTPPGGIPAPPSTEAVPATGESPVAREGGPSAFPRSAPRGAGTSIPAGRESGADVLGMPRMQALQIAQELMRDARQMVWASTNRFVDTTEKGGDNGNGKV